MLNVKAVNLNKSSRIKLNCLEKAQVVYDDFNYDVHANFLFFVSNFNFNIEYFLPLKMHTHACIDMYIFQQWNALPFSFLIFFDRII